MKKGDKGLRKNNFLFVTVIVSILMIITLFFSVVVIMYTNEISEQKILDQLELSNDFTSEILGKDLQVLRNIGKQLYDPIENDYINMPKLLESYAKSNGFEYIVIADLNGVVEYGTQQSSIKTTNGFKAALAGETFISDAKVSSFNGKKTVNFCVPLQANGVTVKVLYGAKSVKQLENDLKACYFERAGKFYLLDSEGIILFKYGTDAWKSETSFLDNVKNSGNLSLAEIGKVTKDLKEHRVSIKNFQTSNGTIMFAISPIDAYPRWTLALVLDTTATAHAENIVLISAIFLVIIVAISFVLWAQIRKNETVRRAEINYISTTDDLTKIGNLNRFYIEAAAILKEADCEYAVLKIDISNFKLINDVLGYTTGDQILKLVAQSLEKNYSAKQACARISGDHFVVLAKNRPNLAESCVEKLKEDISEVLGEARGQTINFNIGKYVVLENSESVVSSLDKSNIALKAAKAIGTGAIVNYSDELVTHIVQEKKLEKMMVRALEQSEFQIYIQPKYRLIDAKFMGAEALVRWENPELGLLSPAKFIPLFERNGFIKELDLYVMEAVMCRMRYLHSVGYHYFPISVNVSHVTLTSHGYVDKVSALFEKYLIPAGVVEVEITETIFNNDVANIIKLLEQLRKLGCLIVMDDFGSGYSSLNILKEVPFDVLKIDRDFLNQGVNCEKNRIILSSMIEMAQKIKVQVVCEGVETQEHVDFLNMLKCDVAQGYFFARPMTLSQFEQELEDKQLDIK